MGLVGYSDSEGSDDEIENEKPKQQTNHASSAKSSVQKVVDSSNPRKIRVNLPEPTNRSEPRDENIEGPPAKKAKTGGGISGFNAMLPAPKKAPTTTNSAGTQGKPRGKGLGRGVNLKTGAAPGFSREPVPAVELDRDELDSFDSPQLEQDPKVGDITNRAVSQSEGKSTTIKPGTAMMFKPLSVARNPKKKKPTSSAAPEVPAPKSDSPSTSNPGSAAGSKPPKPKVSLFSLGTTENNTAAPIPTSTRDYEPMLYQTEPAPGEELEQAAPEQAVASTQNSQSLGSIAADLNLSESARRQLFGRGSKNAQAVNVMNFNTDEEWKANEEMRANGEQQQHNPVRSIAPGKHSLRQLVSAVSNQREALEDSFAAGKRSKKEAGSRYGW